MSALASTQIPKPADEQAFERACVVLWSGLLKDPNVERVGRRGQEQHGVDLFGYRKEDTARTVGIQCKLKGPGKKLTANEVREEVAKALTFKPPLKEYFIVTTAPDDAVMQELARELTAEHSQTAHPIRIQIWGWGSLEERIARDPEALKAFDPGHTAHGELAVSISMKAAAENRVAFGEIQATLATIVHAVKPPADDGQSSTSTVDALLDAEIDQYRTMAHEGRPSAALELFRGLLSRVEGTASGRILFRIKANMGSCLYDIGDEEAAGSLLVGAAGHAPDEPKAAVNKAFGLLIQRRWEDLMEFGEQALAVDPHNEGLAGYLVQAMRFDPGILDPLSRLPASVRNSEDVTVAMVDFARRRTPSQWKTKALEASARFPDNSLLSLFAAEATMEEIINDDGFQNTRLLNEGKKEQLRISLAVLDEHWRKRRQSDGPLRPEDVAVCSNLVLGYYVLSDFEAARRVAGEGLARAPSDPELCTRAMMLAIDADDDALAKSIFPSLPATEATTVLAMRYHSSRQDWAAIAALANTPHDLVPEVERRLFEALIGIASVRLNPGENEEEAVRDLAAAAENDVRATIAVADYAKFRGFTELADACFNAALSGISDDSHFAARVTVAMHAARSQEWTVVAELLNGHVDLTLDSFELRMLANAMVNDTPVRRRAVEFFLALPESVRNVPSFQRAAGMMHFNRGALGQAETALRRAAEIEPSLDNLLPLFATLRRRGRTRDIADLLSTLSASDLPGSPAQKMTLALELAEAGRADEALSIAYATIVVSRNDPEVAMRYFGLVIGRREEIKIPGVETVQVDAWVRIEDADGHNQSFIVTESDNRPGEGLMSTAHPIVAASSDLRVGESFGVAAAFGEKRTWTVTEIKHKYLHALHDVLQNFEARFPNEQGFLSFTAKDEDIQPILDQVKKMADRSREIAAFYLEQHIPLNMVATMAGNDVIGFVDYIRSLGADLTTCSGNVPERLAAAKLIQTRRAGGAVLDTYAAWSVATMNAFDVLTGVFGRPSVTQSTLDDLANLRERNFARGESMTLGLHDGEFVRRIQSAEEVSAAKAFVDEQVEKITAACDVLSVAAPDELHEIARTITDGFGSHVLDATFAAAEGRLLLSEDKFFREYAEQVAGAQGTWLQAVFNYALDHDLLTRSRHSELVASLAWRRHEHVSIGWQALFDAARGETLDDLNALCRFIGNKAADIGSHLKVVQAFVTALWSDDTVPVERRFRATGTAIDALVRHRKDDWAVAVAYLRQTDVPELVDYIDRWTVGHFLDRKQVADADMDLSLRMAAVRATLIAKRRSSYFVTGAWPTKRNELARQSQV
ncbi:tetratricopeptide repeat protein [Devosia naphthalenivorans]|uniref:tetratricopeptide repeat protein n=1 Tax=Devosia naphthalenivorans TaxID=2082392 RepID=UPI000D371875|nr:GreA/GreB family elongation factor [Devosia naphthalenivorans]